MLTAAHVEYWQHIFEATLKNIIIQLDENDPLRKLQVPVSKQNLLQSILEFLVNSSAIGSTSVNSLVIPLGDNWILKYAREIDNDWRRSQFLNSRNCEMYITNILAQEINHSYIPFFNLGKQVYCFDNQMRNGFVLEPRLNGLDLRQWVMNHYVHHFDFERELMKIVVTIVDIITWMYNHNINHNDLHDRNVFIKTMNYTHSMYDGAINIELNYVPVIIDYDWTTVGTNNHKLFMDRYNNMYNYVTQHGLDVSKDLVNLVRESHTCKLGETVLPIFEDWTKNKKVVSISTEDMNNFEEKNCDFFPQHAVFSENITSGNPQKSAHIDLARLLLYMIKLLRDVKKVKVLDANDFPEFQKFYKTCFEKNFNIIECHNMIKMSHELHEYLKKVNISPSYSSQHMSPALSQPMSIDVGFTSCSQPECMSVSYMRTPPRDIMNASQQSVSYMSGGKPYTRNRRSAKKSSSKAC